MNDKRAVVAVDLGAESCRVSLLRWTDGGPTVKLVHRFANSPREADGLRWDLGMIAAGLEEGLRKCAAIAPEGIRSVAVDGWAVDYVRIDVDGRPLEDPFCYRDERTIAAEVETFKRIPADRLRELTGVQLIRINTVYQLFADKLAGRKPGVQWLNLPEYFLSRWGGTRVAELTNATHTQMVELHRPEWCLEVFDALGLDPGRALPIVPPGTVVGTMNLAGLEGATLIAPACHDTASALADSCGGERLGLYQLGDVVAGGDLVGAASEWSGRRGGELHQPGRGWWTDLLPQERQWDVAHSPVHGCMGLGLGDQGVGCGGGVGSEGCGFAGCG